MRRFTAALVGAVLLFAGPALALGINYGARLGVGTGIGAGDKATEDTDFSSFVAGAGVKLDLLVLALEVDLLYNSVTGTAGGIEAKSTSMGVPVIATIGLPVVPLLLDINFGLGLEPRFHLGSEVEGKEVKDDPTEDMVLYLPLVLGGTLNLGVADVDVQIRYLHQLTESVKDSDSRVHHVLFMAGAFF